MEDLKNDSESPFATRLASGLPEVPHHSVFFNGHELRPGWRLLLFSSIVVILLLTSAELVKLANHGRIPARAFTLTGLMIGEMISFIIFLIASLAMAALEKRSLADYGLPGRGAFRGRFWQGALFGFVAISALLLLLWGAGVFHLGRLGLHGAEAFRYALLWGVGFTFVALFEEFSFRGYALFTLSDGLGFWPAAILMSCLFGYVHHGNPGETWLGAFSAGTIGFIFCIMLRRTGSLWLSIGFHAAWDWGETYFYGVPDSGQVAPGHLFASASAGPAWLTGGTVGPEASWLCLLLVFLIGCIVAAALRTSRYPRFETRSTFDASNV